MDDLCDTPGLVLHIQRSSKMIAKEYQLETIHDSNRYSLTWQLLRMKNDARNISQWTRNKNTIQKSLGKTDTIFQMVWICQEYIFIQYVFKRIKFKKISIPYACHYNPWLVYFLPHFRSPFLCFQGGFFRKFCPYVWLVLKSSF